MAELSLEVKLVLLLLDLFSCFFDLVDHFFQLDLVLRSSHLVLVVLVNKGLLEVE